MKIIEMEGKIGFEATENMGDGTCVATTFGSYTDK